MKLIVGLGNPGEKYLFTRHNIGFMAIDSLSENSNFQKKHKSLIQKIQIGNESVLLAKPQTFMNLSGEAVQEIMHFYKIPTENLLIIQDDKDQTFLSLKFQKSRGHGGHNGIRDIHSHLSSNDYARLKLGVAPNQKIIANSPSPVSEKESLPNPIIKDTADFVLAPFTKKEMEHIPDFLQTTKEAIICFIEKTFEEASNNFNQKS